MLSRNVGYDSGKQMRTRTMCSSVTVVVRGRTEFIRWEKAPYMMKREKLLLRGSGNIEGCDRETFEVWGFEEKATVVRGNEHWPGHARADEDRAGGTCSSYTCNLGKSH